MPDDSSQVNFPPPGSNAFQDGALDQKWITALWKLVMRQILVKGPGPDGKVLMTWENIVFDLTDMFTPNDVLWLAKDGVATRYRTFLFPLD